MSNLKKTENYHIPIFGNKNKNVLFSDHLPVEAKQHGIPNFLRKYLTYIHIYEIILH